MRPLTREQIRYASTDAVCLVRLFAAAGGEEGDAAKAALAAPPSEGIHTRPPKKEKLQRKQRLVRGGRGGEGDGVALEGGTWRVENLYERV